MEAGPGDGTLLKQRRKPTSGALGPSKTPRETRGGAGDRSASILRADWEEEATEIVWRRAKASGRCSLKRTHALDLFVLLTGGIPDRSRTSWRRSIYVVSTGILPQEPVVALAC